MRLKQALIVAVIMLITHMGIAYLKNSNDQDIKRSLSDFPVTIDQWDGKISRFEDDIYDILGVDDSILINYYNKKRDNIQLYIGYYQSQREGEVIHSPINCMPGSGWNIVETSLLTLNPKDRNGAPVEVKRLKLQNGKRTQVVLYWYHSRGRIINSEYSHKIYLVWDAIIKQRTDGSFVRLLSPVTEQNEPLTTLRLKKFAEQIFPILTEFIPEQI